MMSRFVQLTLLVVFVAMSGLFLGGCPPATTDTTVTETYPPFEFEVTGQSWVPKTDPAGVTACEHSPDRGYNTANSLKITCAMNSGTTGGMAWVQLDPLVDLSNKTLSAYVYFPTSISPVASTGVNLFVQDENWNFGSTTRVYMSTPDAWNLISSTVSYAPGYSGLDLTKVKGVGLQISIATTTTLSGAIYLDKVNWQ